MVINSLTKIIQEYHHISTNPLWTFPLWDGPYLVNPWVLTAWIQLVTWGPCLCSDSFDLWTFLCRSPMGGNGTFTNKVLLVPHDFKDDFNDYSIYTIYYISLPKGVVRKQFGDSKSPRLGGDHWSRVSGCCASFIAAWQDICCLLAHASIYFKDIYSACNSEIYTQNISSISWLSWDEDDEAISDEQTDKAIVSRCHFLICPTTLPEVVFSKSFTSSGHWPEHEPWRTGKCARLPREFLPGKL